MPVTLVDWRGDGLGGAIAKEDTQKKKQYLDIIILAHQGVACAEELFYNMQETGISHIVEQPGSQRSPGKVSFVASSLAEEACN